MKLDEFKEIKIVERESEKNSCSFKKINVQPSVIIVFKDICTIYIYTKLHAGEKSFYFFMFYENFDFL